MKIVDKVILKKTWKKSVTLEFTTTYKYRIEVNLGCVSCQGCLSFCHFGSKDKKPLMDKKIRKNDYLIMCVFALTQTLIEGRNVHTTYTHWHAEKCWAWTLNIKKLAKNKRKMEKRKRVTKRKYEKNDIYVAIEWVLFSGSIAFLWRNNSSSLFRNLIDLWGIDVIIRQVFSEVL